MSERTPLEQEEHNNCCNENTSDSECDCTCFTCWDDYLSECLCKTCAGRGDSDHEHNR